MDTDTPKRVTPRAFEEIIDLPLLQHLYYFGIDDKTHKIDLEQTNVVYDSMIQFFIDKYPGVFDGVNNPGMIKLRLLKLKERGEIDIYDHKGTKLIKLTEKGLHKMIDLPQITPYEKQTLTLNKTILYAAIATAIFTGLTALAAFLALFKN